MARAIENAGVPLASRSEVATWVKRIAGDTLKRRAKRLAQIESTGSSSASIVPLSGPSLPAEGTATGSESGFRPIRSAEADSSQSVVPFDDDEPRKPSRAGAVIVAMLAALLGASGFFVWRAGGVQPARAKVSQWVQGITNPSWKVTQTAKAAAAAASASAAAEAASQTANAASGDDGLSFEYTPDGKPTPKPRGVRAGVRAHATHTDSSPDPKVTTNVPTGAAGHGGNLGEAIASAAGDNGSVGQDAVGDKPKAASGSVPQRPSQGGVQVAIGGAMGAVRACFSPGNPTSRALVTFQ